MALHQQPAFQRDLLKAHAKASMRGQPLRTRMITRQRTLENMQRKLLFSEMALRDKMADLNHEKRSFELDQSKKGLRERKKGLPWTIGLGIGTAVLSGIEGHSRARRIKKHAAKQESAFNTLMNKYQGIQSSWGTNPIMSGGSGKGIIG